MPGDPPDRETICGLGNRKNELFQALLQREGVEPFDDAVEQIKTWRRKGIMTAMVTSSRNGTAVLKAAGLEDLFDATVDGIDAAELGFEGKPAPDIFIKAAHLLGYTPYGSDWQDGQ